MALRIKEIQERASKRAEIDIEAVLLELAKVGFSDIRRAVKWGEGIAIADGDGDVRIANGVSLVNSENLDPDTAAAISEVVQTKDGIRIKFHDKLGALDKIGRHLGMFVDRHELTGKDGGPIETTQVSPLELARRIAYLFEQGRRALEGK